METIEMKYTCEFDGETRKIKAVKYNEDGLHDTDICEMFMDFMQSVGFSEQNIWNYFGEGN